MLKIDKPISLYFSIEMELKLHFRWVQELPLGHNLKINLGVNLSILLDFQENLKYPIFNTFVLKIVKSVVIDFLKKSIEMGPTEIQSHRWPKVISSQFIHKSRFLDL